MPFINGVRHLPISITTPPSSTDNAVVRFDSTTGKVIQDSGVIITDTDVIQADGLEIG
jgi:hypothetical protein